MEYTIPLSQVEKEFSLERVTVYEGEFWEGFLFEPHPPTANAVTAIRKTLANTTNFLFFITPSLYFF